MLDPWRLQPKHRLGQNRGRYAMDEYFCATIMKFLILFYDYGQDLELQRLDKECREISKWDEVVKYQLNSFFLKLQKLTSF